MDPLIVARTVCKLRDAALIELHPTRHAQFPTDKPVHRFDGKRFTYLWLGHEMAVTPGEHSYDGEHSANCHSCNSLTGVISDKDRNLFALDDIRHLLA